MLFGIGLGLTILGLLGTILPLMRSTQWWVRVLDFPKAQIATILATAIMLMVLAIALDNSPNHSLSAITPPALALVTALIALIHQLRGMLPYTKLVSHQVADHCDSEGSTEIRILIANLLQSNRTANRILSLIKSRNPHLVFVVECDSWWIRQLDVLLPEYPHHVLYPQENGYGMALYSRFPFESAELRFLREVHIPSIHAVVNLPNGTVVRCIGLHPAPPVPTYSQETDQRDAELLLVAKELENCIYPALAFGDLNDVAWSRTTRLFQQISGFLDPRIGRGQYNTYHADFPFLRYPLDHIFVSVHWRLAHLEVLPHIGSDHFPILAMLQLETDVQPAVENLQEEPEATTDTREEVAERIAEADMKLAQQSNESQAPVQP